MKTNRMFGVVILWLLAHLGLSQTDFDYDFESFPSKADEYMKAITRRTAFSGTILLATDNKIIFHKGYGLASRRYLIRMQIKSGGKGAKIQIGIKKIFMTLHL